MAKVQTKVKRPPIVPLKYAGMWIAWSYDHSKIVASGKTLMEAKQKAHKAGEARPWLDRTPDPDVRFGGAAFHP